MILIVPNICSVFLANFIDMKYAPKCCPHAKRQLPQDKKRRFNADWVLAIVVL